jgi:hypothetical protein
MRGAGEASISCEFVQVGANYDAHHRVDAARRYLEAGARGEPCGHLALALAAAVLGDGAVQLAMSVLAGGSHVHARATELASRILHADPAMVGAAESGVQGGVR